jgi:hypothetical protein
VADVSVRASAGTVTTVSGVRVVVLDDGTRVAPLWPATVITDGDRVQVVLVDGVAHVLGPVTTTPRPISGTVAGSATAGLVPITTTAGTVQARYAGTAPSIGTLVGLIWQGSTVMLLPGTLASPSTEVPPDPEVPAAPPATPETGTLLVAASGSGTWRTGSWGWASSADVLQGGSPYVSQDSRGGWWYGDAARVLAGRTITAARLRLGARLRIGGYNAAAAIHLYRTSDSSRPGADFTRVAGPTDVTRASGAGAGWVDLPTGWGQALVDTSGGIAISGSPYAGIAGVGSDPESGQLSLDWTR